MTEEINAFDMDFDPDNPEDHDESVAFVRYAKMCWLPGLSVKKVFESGVQLMLPGITRTKYEKGNQPASTGEPFYFPVLEIDPGNKDKLFTIILREENQDGQEFDNVLRFKNWNEVLQEKLLDDAGQPIKNERGRDTYVRVKGDDGKFVNERNAFTDFQSEELGKLKKFDPVGFDKLRKSGPNLINGSEDPWIYVKAFAEDTGYNRGGEVRQYLKDIVIYPTYEEFLKAKTNDTGEAKSPYGHYPKAWESMPANLKEEALKQWNDGKSLQEISDGCLLTGDSIDGNQVDAPHLLIELLGLNIPAPMLKMDMVKS